MSAMPTVGSSDVAAILGVSRFGSVWETWARLVGLTPRYGGKETAPMRRGKRLEDAVGQWHAQEQDLVLHACPKVGEPGMPGPEPWMHDRPDFMAHPVGASIDRALEIKTTRYLDEADGWGPEGGDSIPLHVAAQSMWHMICQSVDRCDVVAFGTVRDDFRAYRLDHREALADRLVSTVRDWYEHHVVDGNPPALDGSAASVKWAGVCVPYAGVDPAGMSKAAKDASRVWLDATPADVALARDLADVKARIKDLTVAQNALKARMMERIGGAYGVRHEGRSLAIWGQSPGRATASVRALREALGDDAEQFIKTGRPFRRLNTYGVDHE